MYVCMHIYLYIATMLKKFQVNNKQVLIVDFDNIAKILTIKIVFIKSINIRTN